jgi:hypothetical protein
MHDPWSYPAENPTLAFHGLPESAFTAHHLTVVRRNLIVTGMLLSRSCVQLIALDDVSREEFTSVDATTAVPARVLAADGLAGARLPDVSGTREGVQTDC